MTTKREAYAEAQRMMETMNSAYMAEFAKLQKFAEENELILLPSHITYATLGEVEPRDLLQLELPCVHAQEGDWSASTISCNGHNQCFSEEDHFCYDRYQERALPTASDKNQ